MIELIRSIDRILTEPYLVTSLISMIIKSSLILIVAGLTITALRHRSSAIRSYILSLTFIAVLVVPVLTFVTPAWQFSITNIFSSTINTTVSNVSGSGLQSVELVSGNNLSFSTLAMFIAIWIIGSSIILIRIFLGWFLIHRISKRSKITDNQNIIKLANDISAKLRLRRPMNLVFSTKIFSPIVIGLWNHTIIFPKYAQKWSMKKMEMSLTHELAHIKRYDTLWYLIGSITTALYWFNPLVWICRRKLVTEAEIVCDDYVLKCGSDALIYAENLLDIAQYVKQKQFVIPVGAGMTKKSELERRLMSIISDRKRITGVKKSIFILGVLLTLVLVLPLSGMQLRAVETDNTATSTDAYSTGKQSSDDIQKDKEIKQEANGQYPGPDDLVEVTTRPEQIKAVQPEYPEEAQKQNIEGDVWVKVLVDKHGSVIKAKINKSSGSKLLDESALKAAYGCKYKPAMQEGKPVAIWVTYAVTFSLAERIQAGFSDSLEINSIPELIKEVRPEYPEEARKQNIEGDVWVKALVDNQGSVIKSVIAKSSGSELLDESALKASYGYKFKPAMRDNKPIAVWVTYKVTFSLDDDK